MIDPRDAVAAAPASADVPLPAGARASVSRRRVLAGAAWATPAILVATASPPAAASGYDISFAFITPTSTTGAVSAQLQFGAATVAASVNAFAVVINYGSQAFDPAVVEASGWTYKDAGGKLTLNWTPAATGLPKISFPWKNNPTPGSTWTVTAAITGAPAGTSVQLLGPWVFTR